MPVLTASFRSGVAKLISGFEEVKSFNSESVAGPGTKLLIVGTITPPGAGYFYCSAHNRIFGYLDGCFGTNLKCEKPGVAAPKTFAVSIAAIKATLKNKQIAFLDVIDKAVRRNNSPSDDDIAFYTLDFDSFKKIGKDTTVIVNSRLAEEGYVNMAKQLKLKNKAEYVSQRRDTETLWMDALGKAYNGILIPNRQI